jgi:hypothetical protein
MDMIALGMAAISFGFAYGLTFVSERLMDRYSGGHNG